MYNIIALFIRYIPKMYPYIVCYCGCSIGDYYDLFKAMRADKFALEFGDTDIKPNLVSLNDELQVELDDILNMLNITHDCCRTRMMSQIEFKELY